MPTLTGGNDTYNAPLGFVEVDGAGGVDTIVIDYSTLTLPILYSWDGTNYAFDDAFNQVRYWNFEQIVFYGGSNSDDIRGFDDPLLSDMLFGNGGNDDLTPGRGSDSVDGGAGIDRIIVDYRNLPASDNAITLLTGGATSTVATTNLKIANVERIWFYGSNAGGNDSIDSSAYAADDYAYGNYGNDTFSLGLGIDQVDGGPGSDLLIIDYSSLTTDLTTWDPGTGGRRFGDQAGGTNYTEFAYIERWSITGGTGNDFIQTYPWWSGDLADTLIGGDGNDTLYAGYNMAADSIDAGNGVDRWDFDFRYSNAAVTLDISTAVQTVSNGPTISGIERISGYFGGGNDSVLLNPGRFDDWLDAGYGNDTVTSGRGADTMNGSADFDLLVMNWSAATEAITWTDLANGWYRFNTASGADRMDYTGFESFNITGGTRNDSLVGFNSNDTMAGAKGNDTMASGQGNATIDGGVGVDLWSADLSYKTTDVVISLLGSQTTSQGAASLLDIRNIEQISITTGSRNDSIDAGGFTGNDYAWMNDGNDSFASGLGQDTTYGGNGVDTLIVDYSSLTQRIDTVDIGGGWWRLGQTNLNTYVQFNNFEVFNVALGSGNDFFRAGNYNDTITGNAGSDTIWSYGGADSIDGGTGRDSWYGDYSGYGITPIQMIFDATGNTTIGGANATINGVEDITVNAANGADLIDASAIIGGNTTINTYSGNDTVKVGDGRGRIDMGGDFDLLIVDFSTSTTAVRNYDIGGGWWRIGDDANVNRIDYANVDAVNFAGGSADDKLTGGSNADSLNGGAGNDILIGGAGSDVYTGGAGADIFRVGPIWASYGSDTIMDGNVGDVIRVDYNVNLTSIVVGNGTAVPGGQVQVENLVDPVLGAMTRLHIGLDGSNGAGDVVVNLLGTYAPNSFTLSGRLITFAGGSSTTGGVGADTMIGTAGNDTLDGIDGDDILAGNDGDDSLTGGIGNDQINGGSGNDALVGSGGGDTLTGGIGKDVISGGAGVDRIVYAAATESQVGTLFRDVITDYRVSGADLIDLSAIDANPVLAGDQAFAFIGTAAFSGAAGQLRDGGGGIAEFDRNGDGIADWQVECTAFGSFASTMFIL